MKTLTKVALIFAILFTGVAVSMGMNQQDEPRIIEMVGKDNMDFTVTNIEATPGEEITIKLTTKSNMPKQVMAHNVVVVDNDVDLQAFANASARAKDNKYIAPDYEESVIAGTDLAGDGETVSVTFTVPEKEGEYEYICSFPGHYSAGMKGVLTVKG